MTMVVDLFAAGGGWDEGARLAGHSGNLVGLEWDGPACRTAVAAGHARIQCDVATYPTEPFEGRVDGLIASPPCTSFSNAGKRAGFDDPRGLLSHEPLRWARALKPRWVALEQVPEVLPHWRHVAHELRLLGYSTWTGVLCAADYGVPQTRRRAILVARRDGVLATAPIATHAESGGGDDLFGGMPRWVSMAEALGWGLPDRPSWTVSAGGTATGGAEVFANAKNRAKLREIVMYAAGQTSGESAGVAPREPSEPSATITGKGTAAWVLRNNNTANAAERRLDQPAPTMFFGGRCNAVDWKATDGSASTRVTVQEAAVLQGFRPDYPWQGTKTQQYQQVGNAIPPPLAAAILQPLLTPARQVVAA